MLAADELAGLLEHGRAACVDEPVEHPPDAGLAVMPLVPSEPPQMVPTTRSESARVPCACTAVAHLRDPRPARGHRRAGAAEALDDQRGDRAAGGGDDVGETFAVEPLAAQRHQRHRTDVRVGAQPSIISCA